ncbi:MAG: hypothetical protein ACQJCO_01555 [cyanobacterium endosymbiont of Rhopalodia sterrenbergii]
MASQASPNSLPFESRQKQKKIFEILNLWDKLFCQNIPLTFHEIQKMPASRRFLIMSANG